MTCRGPSRNRGLGLFYVELKSQDLSTRFFSALPNFSQTLAYALLSAASSRLVKDGPTQVLRQAFHRVHGVFKLMRVLVAFAISPLFHRPRGSIAKLHRNRLCRCVRHGFHCFVQRTISGVGLGRNRQIDR